MRDHDNQEVLGLIEPEQRPRHVLHMSPDQVAVAVRDGYIAVLVGRRGAHVARMASVTHRHR